MDINGKICVVTGAASGIGRALCLAFADAGAATVVCVDRNGDGAAATADPSAARPTRWMSPTRRRSRT